MVKLSSSRLVGQHLTGLQRGVLSAVMAVFSVVAIYLCICGVIGAQRAKSRSAIRIAKEAVLREDCHVIHQAIDNYAVDLHKAPKSLDVVQAGYLNALPKDFSLEACR